MVDNIPSKYSEKVEELIKEGKDLELIREKPDYLVKTLKSNVKLNGMTLGKKGLAYMVEGMT